MVDHHRPGHLSCCHSFNKRSAVYLAPFDLNLLFNAHPLVAIHFQNLYLQILLF